MRIRIGVAHEEPVRDVAGGQRVTDQRRDRLAQYAVGRGFVNDVIAIAGAGAVKPSLYTHAPFTGTGNFSIELEPMSWTDTAYRWNSWVVTASDTFPAQSAAALATSGVEASPPKDIR